MVFLYQYVMLWSVIIATCKQVVHFRHGHQGRVMYIKSLYGLLNIQVKLSENQRWYESEVYRKGICWREASSDPIMENIT